MKYNYPRADLTIMVSGELIDMVHEMHKAIDVSVQDIAVSALLAMLDPSETCPDWTTINPALSGRNAPEENTAQRRTVEKGANWFVTNN